LEPEFILELQRIAKNQNTSVAAIISNIDKTRSANSNLSSAIRVWILNNIKN
ncbi:MAG: ribbon-helix-helix domain-containing protein, partial [Alphaproteobacteria bacterium]|nr:ribbon-helix-helix domain-containing protein [Alphaproteobacteria bacterium]